MFGTRTAITCSFAVVLAELPAQALADLDGLVSFLHLIWLTGLVDERADAAQEAATEAEVERPAAGHVKCL